MSFSRPPAAKLCAALLLPVCLLALRSSVAAAHPSSPDPVAIIGSARQAIEAANTGWLPAMERGDADTVAADYAPDGVLITSQGVAVRGRSAIAARYRAEIAQLGRVIGGGLVQEGVTVSGGLIYEWGHGWLAFEKEGKRKVSSGPYFTVWKRGTNGDWAIIRNLVL